MKLLEITAVYPPYRGGIGAVARDNARMAAESGYTVTICTPRYPNRALVPREFDNSVVVKRLRPLFSYGNAAILPGVISEVQTSDIVHLHYPFLGTDAIAALACGLFRKKLYITYHMDLTGKGMARWIFSLYTALFLPVVLKYACHIFVTSDDYALHSHLRKFRMARHDSYSVLPCAVDIERFSSREKDHVILNRHGIMQSDLVILFVGGLDDAHYFKGVDVLIDAFASFAADIPHSHLMIVGDGNLRMQYERHAERRCLTHQIHFAGSVSDDELPRYYASVDLCTLPSLDESEAFGIALLEAFASGKPVIATRIRGVRSVVRNGIDGILVAPGSRKELADALVVLLHDSEKRRIMGASARQRAVESFSYAEVKKQFISQLTIVN